MMSGATADQPVVVLDGVGRDYGGVAALEALDLALAPGQAVAVVGHNGSGKTTALSMLAGRLEPTRGKVLVGGVDVYRHDGSAMVRSIVSFIPDSPALYTDLTVADHLELVGMAHGVEAFEERAGILLERFGLEDRRHLLPRELSRGMRQKTQLACALLRPFGVLVLDEPVAGLDPPSRRILHSLLVDAKREGAAVVLSTHQISFADGLADQVIVLREGRLAAAGTPQEVMEAGWTSEGGPSAPPDAP